MTMLHFGLSSALLLAATCMLMTKVSTEMVITCDDSSNVQHLSCDQGVISVQAALYGRLNSETCSEGRPGDQVTNINCSQNGTVNIIRRSCDGKRVCEFNTFMVRATDPCFGTYKYVETNFICVPAIRVTACEGSTASLFCDPGQEIVVLGAYYGRSDQTTCSFERPNSQTQNTLCIHHTSRVAKSCEGRNSCTVRASNSVFGDPCVGTYKYLEVSYVCQYPLVAPDTPHLPE